MDQIPGSQPENGKTTPAPRTASFLQRVIEHGVSFAILIPALASFFIFISMMLVLIPSRGPAEGIGSAFAFGSGLLLAAYMIGAAPSLIVGLAAYPLWRQFGGGWQLYPLAALFNATLCAAVFAIFWGGTATGVLCAAVLATLATLASVFLTRKLRT